MCVLQEWHLVQFLIRNNGASNFNALCLLSYNSVKPLIDNKTEYLAWPPALSVVYLDFSDI